VLNVPDWVGVPLSVAVPLPLSWKLTPLGNVPDWLMLGVGDPVVVTVNVPNAPTVNVVLLALVIAGGSPITMVTLTSWLSTVAVPLPSPGVFPALKVAVPTPLVRVVLAPLMVPSVAPKDTGVPLGTLNPVPPLELVLRSAIKPVLPFSSICVEPALMLSTSQGLVVKKPLFPLASTAVSQPLAPGPPLQPHQLSVAVTPDGSVLAAQSPVPLAAPSALVFPEMRELEMVISPRAWIAPPWAPPSLPPSNALLPVNVLPLMVVELPLCIQL